jgi:hypothetical protein
MAPRSKIARINAASLIAGSILLIDAMPVAQAQTGNCVITGGMNYGSIIQNCNFAPPPLSVISKEFENIRMPDGTFRRRIFVQVGQPITLLLIACGDDVSDVSGGPSPAGMSSQSDLMVHASEKCVGRRFFNTQPGKWEMWATTKAEDSKFTLQPVIE